MRPSHSSGRPSAWRGAASASSAAKVVVFTFSTRIGQSGERLASRDVRRIESQRFKELLPCLVGIAAHCEAASELQMAHGVVGAQANGDFELLARVGVSSGVFERFAQ